MEHLHHFGLSADPFRREPGAEDFFPTPASQDALRRLERAIRQQRGLVLLSGDTGCGKSLVVRQLLEALEEEVFEAGMVVLLRAETDAEWLLARFARLLGVDEPDAGRDALLAQVYERMAIVREDGRHTVLIVDDAEALAAAGALVDVCGLLKLEYEERRLFTLVLVGGAALVDAFPSDAPLGRRLETHVRLRALDLEATARYLQRRIERAGGDTALVPPEVVAALHAATGGCPGLVNVLADNALYEAYVAGRGAVAPEDVARASADLGWGDALALTQPHAAPAPLETEAPLAVTADEAGVPVSDAPAEPVAAPESADLGSELDGVFAETHALEAELAMPLDGPPKEDEEELVVALLEE